MKYLNKFDKPIVVEGPVYYNNMDRVKNIIRLKKKLLTFFGDLPKEEDLFYRTEIYPDFEQFTKRIEELKANKTMPILLFLLK